MVICADISHYPDARVVSQKDHDPRYGRQRPHDGHDPWGLPAHLHLDGGLVARIGSTGKERGAMTRNTLMAQLRGQQRKERSPGQHMTVVVSSSGILLENNQCQPALSIEGRRSMFAEKK